MFLKKDKQKGEIDVLWQVLKVCNLAKAKGNKDDGSPARNVGSFCGTNCNFCVFSMIKYTFCNIPIAKIVQTP
jgi:hypothetical protein